MRCSIALLTVITVPFLYASCSELPDSPMGSDHEPSLAKGGGNPGTPGAGGGGDTSTIALGGGYSTFADQVVGFDGKGKDIVFEAVTENKIEYELDLPPYGGDDVCVPSDDLPQGTTAEEFWNEFVATQNDITLRSFLFYYRDDRPEGNRTEGVYSTPEDKAASRGRVFRAGRTNILESAGNATITVSPDGSVYTLSGGSLQVRFVVAPGGGSGGSVTCPNTRNFVVTVKN